MSQIKLKVADIQELTPNIKMFELKSADGGHLPSWEAGSHIDFQIDEHLRRSYSLANKPGDTERFIFGCHVSSKRASVDFDFFAPLTADEVVDRGA